MVKELFKPMAPKTAQTMRSHPSGTQTLSPDSSIESPDVQSSKVEDRQREEYKRAHRQSAWVRKTFTEKLTRKISIVPRMYMAPANVVPR